MLPCAHVCVLLARTLTTPTLRFQQPFQNLFHYKSLGVGSLLQGKAWSCISQGSYYAGLTIFSLRASVQYPSSSVCISWLGRQLINIISDLVLSKKQISGIGATSLIDGDNSSNYLSVSVCPGCVIKFSMIPSPNSSNWTIEGTAATAAGHWRVLHQCARRKARRGGHISSTQ